MTIVTAHWKEYLLDVVSLSVLQGDGLDHVYLVTEHPSCEVKVKCH